MADQAGTPAFPIPADLVDFILLGPADDRRQLQDSPILGDVWLAYAADPAGPQDLLITPYKTATAGRVAKEISSMLAGNGKQGKRSKAANIAYLQGIVAARLHFNEVLRILVPVTQWWHERAIRKTLDERYEDHGYLRAQISALFESGISPATRSPQAVSQDNFNTLERYVALAGLILWASRQKPSRRRTKESSSMQGVLKAIGPKTDEIVDELLRMFAQTATERADVSAQYLIFQVSLNRLASPALTRSIPAVKADAAHQLFNVDCSKIGWAVLDSGIDRDHVAFKGSDGKTRVKATFDFTRIRELVSSDNAEIDKKRLGELIEGTGLNERDARDRLKRLADDARNERPINWDVIEELLTLDKPPVPTSVHGTHVAGIIGASKLKDIDSAPGMCPDINLYDFRVLARTMENTEFAIIAALQYIRFINERHNYVTVHGANLSLSIPHNVRNYACGRTPVCNECQRLVESGVVVVAAAGNRGYQRFETKDGTFEGYAAFSVTDPGNAEDVITVGATHPASPHAYGVSFFSSRGPTGDGRLKPDLVAPGERIQAPFPGNNEWGQESGTSMAAPHVSGAAAMLMARYGEFIGQPRRIKRILCESATDLGRERTFQGHGMLDVLRALQSI